MTEDSAITMYFKKAGERPLLTRDEERSLFARAKAGDAEARDELVERNLRLVVPTAKKYARAGTAAFADLLQEGAAAVATACDRFDPSLGNKFSTYATYWIRQRISRYVKKHGKNIFVPEHIVNLAGQSAKAIRSLQAKGVESPGPEEIAEELAGSAGIKAGVVKVAEALKYCQPEASLSAKVGDDGGTELGDLLEDEAAPDPGAGIDAPSACESLEAALPLLSPLEREVVMCRYGLGVPDGGMTVAQVAERFGAEFAEAREAARSGLAAMGAQGNELEALTAA